MWLRGEVKTPPLSAGARRTAGFLHRLLQQGASLSMPASRPMPTVGPRCHELRVRDGPSGLTWRIIYRVDDDAIVIGDVFAKKTRATPRKVIDNCADRFRRYDAAA